MADSPELGWKARDFALAGVDGKTCTLAGVRGPKGTLVAFICNHCPYVKDQLQYRGRLDASRTTLVPGARRALYEAMKLVAETGRGPREQLASAGCSIKWRRED
jgi:hypothetical protein